MKSRTSTRIASASGGSSTGSKRNIGVATVVSLPVRVEARETVRDASDISHQFLRQAGCRAGGEMDIDGGGESAEALLARQRQSGVGAAGGKDADGIVGNFGAHPVPLALHRHAMQLA